MGLSPFVGKMVDTFRKVFQCDESTCFLSDDYISSLFTPAWQSKLYYMLSEV